MGEGLSRPPYAYSAIELDQRTRKILTAVSRENILSSCHELVALGFSSRTSFALCEGVIIERERHHG